MPAQPSWAGTYFAYLDGVLKGTLLLGVGLVTTGASFAQSIVFDNTTHSLNNNMHMLPAGENNSLEVGDDIWLVGTDRWATELKILMTHRGSLSGTFDAQIRFRSVIEETQTPGEAFFDSGLLTGLTIHAGINEYTFSLPGVQLPDHFVWTIQGFNRQGAEGEFGPSYFNPATVGFSDDFFWMASSATDWTPYSWGGDPYANFAAQITAVPEPGSMLALAAGIGLLARLRKKPGR